MHLGENLQYLRKSNGNMTQEKLAERMRVSRQTVSKWESSESIPELSKLLELCDIFSCSLDTLIREDMAAKSSSSSPVQIRHIQGFRYACSTIISKHPREDSRRSIEAMAQRNHFSAQDFTGIGWPFPYLSLEQKQRFGLQGYVSALLLPEEFTLEDPFVEVHRQAAADYAVITVRDPFTPPHQRISQAYETIMEYLKLQGIQKQYLPDFLPCFERLYQKDGIAYMDIYVHCYSNTKGVPTTL